MVPSCQILFSIQTVYNHTYNREYIPARHAVWARNAGLESLMTSSGNHPLTWASSLLPLHAHPHPRWHPQSPFQASRGSQPAQWERRRCLAWGGGDDPWPSHSAGVQHGVDDYSERHALLFPPCSRTLAAGAGTAAVCFAITCSLWRQARASSRAGDTVDPQDTVLRPRIQLCTWMLLH